MIDLSASSRVAARGEARRLAILEARRPFDLASGPLLRVLMLRLGDREHVVLLTIHHIVTDGWSMGVAALELATLYEAYSTGKAFVLAGAADPVRRLRRVAAAAPSGCGARRLACLLVQASRWTGATRFADRPAATGRSLGAGRYSLLQPLA